MDIARSQITGLVLAGGRGSRMGGVDKGLLLHRGQPLALQAARRLAPQVGDLLISANRHHDVYAGFGWPVVADVDVDAGVDVQSPYPGPLAGMLAGLRHCSTPYLATVACDTPGFPTDLVLQLAQALQHSGAPMAMAFTPADDGHANSRPHAQPVFCLLQRGLHDSLAQALRSGVHKVRAWAAQQGCVPVLFHNAAAFGNANTPQELQALQAP